MPLPLVYEESPGGGAFPVCESKEERIVGVAVNLDDIANSAFEMRHKLHEEVLLPIEQWLQAFKAIKVRPTTGCRGAFKPSIRISHTGCRGGYLQGQCL